jgi:D-alanine-D-alanine ligase
MSIKVAVLRGGPSPEYSVSLKTGQHVLNLLRETPDRYEPIDIFISGEGEWHREGLVEEPHRVLRHIDVVWNALHGRYGEDGQVQRVLESLQIPFTGSSAVASALAMNKEMSKRLYKRHSLLTPAHKVITRNSFNEDQLIDIFRNYLHPVIIKPSSGGSSLGIELAHNFLELENKIKKSLESSEKVLIEEFIRGKEATCGVVEGFRGQNIYALMPIEIRRSVDKYIFDYDSKYSGQAEEICPSDFKDEENKTIEKMAKEAHEILGLRHYSRSDFMLTSSGKIYILETNSLPGLTAESLLPKSIYAAGWQPREFVDHVLKLVV